MNRCTRHPSAWLLAAWLVGPTLAQPSTAGIETPLVVTQVPASSRPAVPRRIQRPLARPHLFDRARLVVLAPDGQLRLLSGDFESACDPNVSFDAQRVLFAGRRAAETGWRIWEIGLDGQGLRPVSPENLDACQPIHVSTLFTLDSPKPWYTLLFVGRDPLLNEVGQPGVWSLYNLKLDGTELRRLTFNPNANLDPFQMWDGRVLYAAERHPTEPQAAKPHVGIYAIHLEGADMELYGGELGKRIQRTPCATDSGLVVFVESENPTADGSGQLACLEEPRPHATYRSLTHDSAFRYRNPAPLVGNQVLVSRRPANRRGNWGLFSFDADRGTSALVLDTPEFHEVQAVAATARRSPDGHSTVVETRYDTGIFYGLNCYDADARMAPHLQTGMVKRVRFIEGVPAPTTANGAPRAEPPFVHRRLLGEAPVEADGSFNVEVPVDIPLLLQTLDERGMALATCGWIWVKPREKRGCIGCHEDPERIPENEYVLALQRPSNRLVLPPDQRRTVTFRKDVAPILQSSCATADCHGTDGHKLHLPIADPNATDADLRTAYERLLTPAAGGSNALAGGRYVDAGRARTSPLAWHLTGRNTAQPWDPDRPGSPPGQPVALMPPQDKSIPLRPEQIRTLIQWIDLGAPFDAPSARNPLPPAPQP